ncbi:MAG: virulence protein RhuM/Fic/DOC family protein [Bacilli bacterium]|nr:virulence protein RhuM/Fic/DOC family protein [Bacilli bacterium]
MKNEIAIFEDQDVKLEVNMSGETVWLNVEQLSKLFGRDRTVIIRHINSIFKENELTKKEVCAKFAHTTEHGAVVHKTQTRDINYYNLDLIISVGYRVKSKKGIAFRKWANKVLKDYLLKGYAINEERLKCLEKTVKLIDIAGRMDFDDSEANNVIRVINNYAKALNLLNDYDRRNLVKPKGITDDRKILYEDCIDVVSRINCDSDLFALERDKGLSSIINDIYQSFDGKDLYKTIEEKAANFLYLIVKDHVFIDGNKRIAAALFIYFLNFYNILYKKGKRIIENNALVALILLIAESNPTEKQILIDLIMNFLGADND